jgi:hypothetical protein
MGDDGGMRHDRGVIFGGNGHGEEIYWGLWVGWL